LTAPDGKKESTMKAFFLEENQRRYLNFLAIRKILGSIDDAVATIDQYIEHDILYRGFIFKCLYCSNRDWYSIANVTKKFKCSRCGKEQTVTKPNWRLPDEPSWFYQLDEILYQAIRSNAIVPLLTLDYLRRESTYSFLYTNELRLSKTGKGGHFVEIDICCIPDGQLSLGESRLAHRIGKSGDEARASAIKYMNVAEEINATMVVFATLAES
jgi:hypothetical protein